MGLLLFPAASESLCGAPQRCAMNLTHVAVGNCLWTGFAPSPQPCPAFEPQKQQEMFETVRSRHALGPCGRVVPLQFFDRLHQHRVRQDLAAR